MTMATVTAEQAWVQIHGSTYDMGRDACVHFTAGFYAGMAAVR